MIDNQLIMLYVGDLHFGAYKSESRFYNEIEKIFYSKVEELNTNLDYVIISGDIFHRILSQNEEAGINASKFILKMNNYSILYDFKLLILRGTRNHDFNQLEPFRRLEVTNPNIKFFNTVDIYNDTDKNLSFLILPEEYVSNPEEYYKPYLDLDEDEKYDFIFGHGTMDFAGYTEHLIESEKSVKSAITFKSKEFKNLTYGCTLFSHIHIGIESNNVYYPGSFSRFSFGEEEEKGFFEVHYDLETLETELIFIENTLAPTYVTLDLDTIDKDIKDISKYINEMKSQYDYIRIIAENVSNDEELNVEMLKEYSIKDKSLKVEVKNRIRKNEEDSQYDYISKRELDIQHTIQRFIKEKNNENIDIEFIENVIFNNELDDEEESE